ncbi:solute carrier family 25 (mitochondrial S-adenosylmethionine transporter), member 26 [Fistulifera solaris]|uniref:Solute carrier family 25 (Mitochondrial S-adenosylmethionine transporter), member 26 n=1 Tax=Fistulifera solaris TaxID=1519565 RepID=A0A1Z5KTK6_FISSO|nr:solute carrier family 25 (mitochondrial S-adenosylmethionine transporter), member 26 [Fistulifera solaris]|eukprot:GAX29517.1 solute carrier family 25 (mitochondrial S-adenosylmethionine transporter), member 26 [Fistulifera solaris]
MSSSSAETPPPFLVAMLAGGLAGTSVDVTLFPLDTLKTRLQAPGGFIKAGGFRGVYNGLGAAALGSAPGAALFFSTYETMKVLLVKNGDQPDAVSHMTAASIGEAAACLVRVPTEVVKAKMQTSATQLSLQATIASVLKERSGSWLSHITGGLYRGYGITLFREIPFAMIQFPLYEYMKLTWARQQNLDQCTPVQAAICGSCSGGLAAGLTTPLDVLKTRLMLGADQHGTPYTGVSDVLRRTLALEGQIALWSGVQPRVMWISIGGFVFFGAYETFKTLLMTSLLAH